MAERRRTQDVARKDNAKRTLMWLFAFIIMLTGALGYGVWKKDASWTPALGLDLEGGFQFILSPRTTDGGSVSQQQLEEARDIIVQRIDAQGTSGAEVTTQGSSNIVVAMPGVPTKEQQDAIAASSQMQFRPVLATDIGDPEAAQPQPSASSSSGSGSSGSGSSSSSSSSAQPSASRSSSTPASRNQERTAEPTPSSSGSGSGTSSPSSSASAPSSSSTAAPTGTDPSADSWKPTGEPTSATDPNHISTKLWREFQDLNCAKPPEDQPVGKTDEAIVACKDDGSLKYVLGPVVVAGTEIADAEAGYRVGPQGQQTNEPEIQLTLTSKGRKEYGDVSKQMVKLPGLNPASPTNPPGSYNALAAVLDSKVLIDPGFNEAIPNGQASISGFSIDEARSLAKSLKFGALPLSFDVQSRQEISPTLGSEQLRYGIIAGLIGLFVVLLYALLQYRALSVVVIGSMLVAFGITYLAIALLAWGYNYRLDMAGVTGLIIAIGVTADSFIVYFERVRDELREGRNLRAAVEAGWARAKGTILVADGVNLIAAVVLYVLASSGVRGFAFTLGLTTLIDLAIFWLFTHPLLTILARNKFFASGHKWSGFDVDTLREAKVRYKGRGNFDIDNPVAVPAEGSAR
ncbi:protein translocase subunit SecD [Janibacter indicus]|uniref:Protein translocase subunit SecD n=1 Tax=Janibacter indicus TaxID=857417 RepID=A0A1W2D1T4_9MICO|nr:protein translocase subunit SecD [Janibacter indicus]SMC91471.1 preprotein translocase subunit SecD [Janibacter indicus]